LARRWLGAGTHPLRQRSPTLRRYIAMLSHNATHCLMCKVALVGKQRKYCSRTCKFKAFNGSYDFQKSRGRKRKQQLVELMGGCCSRGGYNRCLAALSFHHVDPSTKSFQLDLRCLSNRTWERILAEAKKCTLLCFNCHMEAHHA
jgi:hypothetical protein